MIDMKKTSSLLLILLLAACSQSAAQTLGMSRKSPDEYMVLSRPPLSVPPDFTLRAPTDEPSLKKKEASANEMVLGKTQGPPPPAGSVSEGESELLQKAGAKPEDKMVRTQLTQDELKAAKEEEEEKNQGFFSWLGGLFKKDEPKPEEPVVDADKEKQRIENNLQQNKSPAEGTPATTTPKDAGLVDKVF